MIKFHAKLTKFIRDNNLSKSSEKDNSNSGKIEKIIELIEKVIDELMVAKSSQ
jgi:hypothetical protein